MSSSQFLDSEMGYFHKSLYTIFYLHICVVDEKLEYFLGANRPTHTTCKYLSKNISITWGQKHEKIILLKPKNYMIEWMWCVCLCAMRLKFGWVNVMCVTYVLYIAPYLYINICIVRCMFVKHSVGNWIQYAIDTKYIN